MIKIFIILSAMLCVIVHAATEMPAVGVLEQVPVVGPDMRVKARPVYILTNTKLTSATVFTGLQSHGNMIGTICCFTVDNLNPISLQSELSKYLLDPDYVSHMKSIKGYSYIYAAHPAPESLWNDFMKTITPESYDPMDSSMFSAPVTAGTIKKKIIPDIFNVGEHKVALKTEYPRNTTIGKYTFVINGARVIFTEDLPSAE